MEPTAILHCCYFSRGDFQLLKIALLFKIVYILLLPLLCLFAEKDVNYFSLPPLNSTRALKRCSSKILIVVKMLYDGCLKLYYRFLNTKSDAPPTCGGMKVTVRYPQNFIDILKSWWTTLFHFIFLFTNFERCTPSSCHVQNLSFVTQNDHFILKILQYLKDTLPP